MKQDIREVAKRICQELKERFPNTKFSVRVERYSMGETINVFWTNQAASDRGADVRLKYEDIDRDPATGEILCGSNRYAHAHRTVTNEIRERVRQEVKEKYPDFDGWELHEEAADRIGKTDYYGGNDGQA